MGTFLFGDIIFGPVSSRRLGRSLGINLLPGNRKICNYNCLYCECGWTCDDDPGKSGFPDRDHFNQALKSRLEDLGSRNNLPDTITFAGNGEPTLHPDFEEIIDRTISLRNHLAPEAKIAVLTNGTLLHKDDVFNALSKIDQNIIKLDSANPETIRKINQPKSDFDLERFTSHLLRFKGEFMLQSLFFRGKFRNTIIDNSTKAELDLWLEFLKLVQPKEVMVYTFHRDTPERGLTRLSAGELELIAAQVEKLGIKTRVSA